MIFIGGHLKDTPLWKEVRKFQNRHNCNDIMNNIEPFFKLTFQSIYICDYNVALFFSMISKTNESY